MIHNVSIAYFSPTQSTKKVALYVALGLDLPVPTNHINLTNPSARKKRYHFKKDHLLLIAVPSYGGRIPVVTPHILEGFSADDAPATIIVTYGNKGYEDALMECKNELLLRGFLPMAAASIVTAHSVATNLGKNRPNSEDYNIATQLGQGTRNKLERQDFSIPSLPGNAVYKDYPPHYPVNIVTKKECIRCYLCHKWCPTGAIDPKDPSRTDADICIKCQGCIKRCPVSARAITDIGYLEKVRFIEETFGDVTNVSELFL